MMPTEDTAKDPSVIVRAAKCGHHYNDECRSCADSIALTNNELDELRAEITLCHANIATKAEFIDRMINNDARNDQIIDELKDCVRIAVDAFIYILNDRVLDNVALGALVKISAIEASDFLKP